MLKLHSAYKSWLKLAAIAALIVIIPALISPKLPETITRQVIIQEQSDVVFIGNSMLGTRIDIAHYERINEGREAVALIDNGLQSKAWYLRLKNYVVGSGMNTKVVFIFFRNDALTDPARSSSALKSNKLEKLKVGDETVYESIVDQQQRFDQRLSSTFLNIYSIQSRKSSAVEALRRSAASLLFPDLAFTTVKRAVSIAGVGTYGRDEYRATLGEYNELKRSVNETFDLGNFRSVEASDIAASPIPRFGSVVESSLLPLIIDLVSDSDIKLVFVRVKPRPNRDGTTRSRPGLPEYISELETYLDSRGVGFIDMGNVDSFGLDVYLEGDHIMPSFMPGYTEIFSQESAGYFQ
jgi:hypothetical protein